MITIMFCVHTENEKRLDSCNVVRLIQRVKKIFAIQTD